MNHNDEKSFPDPIIPDLHLSQWLESHLGINDNWPIKDKKLARVIEILSKDTYRCHIQWVDHNGDVLKTPLVWRYNAWVISCQNVERQRARAAEEREEKFIFDANVKIIERKMLRICQGFTPEFAHDKAWKLLKNKELQKIAVFIPLDNLVKRIEDVR